jgi:AcrR family transcriptional regulator
MVLNASAAALMDDDTARSAVLHAADRLFYEHGIRAVGMDQVRDDSGVSLKRLYKMFSTKEQLAEAVLRRRDRSFRQALAAYVATLPDARAGLLGVFDFLYDWFSEPDYRGCPFINAYGEMSTISEPVTSAVTDQKQAFDAFLADLAARAGAPRALAEQLFILANGAMVAAAMLHSPEPARQAQSAARILLENAKLGETRGA